MEKIMGSNLGFTIKSLDFFKMIMFRTHIKLIKLESIENKISESNQNKTSPEREN